MTKLDKQKISVALLTGSVLLLTSATPVLAASFNDTSNDLPTLSVMNYTRTPGCLSCWSSSVSADIGDTISFEIYYHNTAADTAQNVKTRISSSINGSGRTISATGNVWADNASLVTGFAQATVPTGSTITSLTYVGTFWYPNQSTSGAAALPFGQSGSEVLNSSGLNIGNVTGPGLSTQGTVAVRFRIEGTRNASDSPTADTFSATGIDRESARLRGEANPRGDSTRVWFEWGRSSSNLNRETSDQSVGSGNNAVEFSSSISGLDPDTTYYFRAIARNSFGTVRGDTKSFYTGSERRFDRPLVGTLAATNITANTANIRGEVNPNASRTNAWFEWGTNPSNLVNRTGTVSVGSGDNLANISSFLAGLNPNTAYYYRVAAENNAGTSFGSIGSFRTNVVFVPIAPSVPAPSEVITQVVRVIQREVAAPAERAIKLTLEADKREINKSKIVYSANYENLTGRTLQDGIVEIYLPDKLEFVDSDRQVDEVSDNTLIFKIGKIRSGDRGRIEVRTEGTNLKKGDQVTVTASLGYLESNNVRYVVSATDIIEVTDIDLAGGGLTATIFDAFKEFLANPIFGLLVGALLLYLIYRFLTARGQPFSPISENPPVSGPEASVYPVPPRSSAPAAPLRPIDEPAFPPKPPEGPPFG